MKEPVHKIRFIGKDELLKHYILLLTSLAVISCLIGAVDMSVLNIFKLI